MVLTSIKTIGDIEGLTYEPVIPKEPKKGIDFGWLHIPKEVEANEIEQGDSELLNEVNEVLTFLTDRYHERGLLPDDKEFQLQDIAGRHLLIARDSEGTIKGVVGLAFRERFSGLPMAEDLSQTVRDELYEQVTIPQDAIFVEVGRLSVVPEDEISDYIIQTGAVLIIQKIFDIWCKKYAALPIVLSALTFNTPIKRRNGDIAYHDPSGNIFAQLSRLLIEKVYYGDVQANATYTRVLLADTEFLQDSLACQTLMQWDANILKRLFKGNGGTSQVGKFSIKVISAPTPLSEVGKNHYGGVLSLQANHRDVLQRLLGLNGSGGTGDRNRTRDTRKIAPACAPFVAHVTIVTPTSLTA